MYCFLRLIWTIAAATATPEQICSNLKLIKDNIRATMTQENFCFGIVSSMQIVGKSQL